MKRTATKWWLSLGLLLLFGLAGRLLFCEDERAARGVAVGVSESPLESTTPERPLAGLRAPALEDRAPISAASDPETKKVEGDAAPTSGVVTGRIVVREGRARDAVEVQLVRESDSNKGVLEHDFGNDGTFRFRVAEGSYRLVMNLCGGFPGTHSIPGIRVRAGETIALEPIELESLTQTVLLDVRDEQGARVPDLRLWLEGSVVGAPNQEWSPVMPRRTNDGLLLLACLGSLPERLRVGAPEFFAQVITNLGSRERVVLVRGPRVHLQITGGLPRVPEPWYLLVNVGREDLWEPETMLRFDSRGGATLAVSRVGSLYVRLALKHPDEVGHHSLENLGWQIDVQPGPTEQAFTSPPFNAAFLDNIERITRAR